MNFFAIKYVEDNSAYLVREVVDDICEPWWWAITVTDDSTSFILSIGS